MAEDLIARGRVTVDGMRATIGMKVDPAAVRVEIDGVPLPVKPDLVHYLLYKPVGTVSTADDPHGREAVVDLVPAQPRVFPVGRLDADSEGLIILTNDGDLTNIVTHPRFGISKTYIAHVKGSPGRPALRRLTEGVELEDGPARAVSARRLQTTGGASLVEVVMREGRKREVRRMFDEIGFPVRRLVRIAIGPVTDRTLAPGSWRRLDVDEVRSLFAAGTATGDDEPETQRS